MPNYVKIFFTLISILLFFSACEEEKQQNSSKLDLLDSYQLDLPEPSGLSISHDGKSLWTVSDDESLIFNITFNGEIIDSFLVDGTDLEGITIIDDSLLAIVLEKSNEIAILNYNGKVITKRSLELKGEENSGLEGITFDKKNKVFYLVNEKAPGLLLKLNYQLEIIEKIELNFAKDYSAIFYDYNNNLLWVLSDESKTLYKTTITGKILTEYDVFIPKPEGVAIDFNSDRIYVVSDNTAKLYIFRLP